MNFKIDFCLESKIFYYSVIIYLGNEALKMTKWRVLLEQDIETGDWAVYCPELPGCTSCGETEEEALNNIKEAIELYLQPDEIELSPHTLIREVIL